MANEIVVGNPTFLAPAASVNDMLAMYQAKKDFIDGILRSGVDFGVIPGSDKPALFKPGAEKMVSFFGLSPTFDDIATIEDWTGEQHNGEPFFYYRQKCKLYKGERVIATADGSCNSWEKKYRYRNSERTCPQCGNTSIFKSKNKPEFYCWAKKGGCGATFPLTDKRITDQEVGQIKNPDVSELTNTILKMAQKRALVAAVLIGTAVSDYFTQDVEDFTSENVMDAQFRDVTEHKQDRKPITTTRPIETTITELGLAPEQEPTMEVQAKPTAIAYPPELAVVTDSMGIPYYNMETAELAGHMNSILKALKEPGITEDKKAKYNMESQVIREILAIRNSK
jgi:hypothetical protein